MFFTAISIFLKSEARLRKDSSDIRKVSPPIVSVLEFESCKTSEIEPEPCRRSGEAWHHRPEDCVRPRHVYLLEPVIGLPLVGEWQPIGRLRVKRLAVRASPAAKLVPHIRELGDEFRCLLLPYDMPRFDPFARHDPARVQRVQLVAIYRSTHLQPVRLVRFDEQVRQP